MVFFLRHKRDACAREGSSLLTGDGRNKLEEIWNSEIARAIIPDVIGINFTYVNVLGIGYGLHAQGFVLTRGKDIGFHGTYGTTARVGVDVGVSGSGFTGRFLGDPRNATFNSMLGYGGMYQEALEEWLQGDGHLMIQQVGQLGQE